MCLFAFDLSDNKVEHLHLLAIISLLAVVIVSKYYYWALREGMGESNEGKYVLTLYCHYLFTLCIVPCNSIVTLPRV